MTPSRWCHFTEEELTCRCGCGQMPMDHEFMMTLVTLRDLVGFALPVNSGYRCPDHNATVSKTGRSGPHTTGMAVDVAVNRVNATVLLRMALMMGFAGVGAKQHGSDDKRFIHLDMVDRPEQIFWTY